MESFWFETDVASRHQSALKFDHLSLQKLGLSNRTLNALLSYNVKLTVGDLIRADENFTIKGLGEAGIEELNSRISQLLTETRNIEVQLSTDQSRKPLNSEAPESQLLQKLSQAALNIPLDLLHLDMRTHEALVKAGIVSIGDLYNASDICLQDIKGLHSGSLGNLNDSIISLLNSSDQGGDIDWFQYWKAQGIWSRGPAR